MKKFSRLHTDQVILGAVQLGACADLNDVNPYKTEDKKRYLGWQQGHSRVIEENRHQQEWEKVSWIRRVKCKIGLHQHRLKRIPGRPHIDPKTGKIDRRDPIIEKYTCICGDVYFLGLLSP